MNHQISCSESIICPMEIKGILLATFKVSNVMINTYTKMVKKHNANESIISIQVKISERDMKDS